MQEFEIRLGSVQDVQDFVALATSRSYLITVRDAYNKINAQSFMELFCLNFSRPLRVVAECRFLGRECPLPKPAYLHLPSDCPAGRLQAGSGHSPKWQPLARCVLREP